jgi:hypothetical protein
MNIVKNISRFCSVLFFCLAVIALVIVFGHLDKNMTDEQARNGLFIALGSIIAGAIAFWISTTRSKEEKWNDLSPEEKAKVFAKELKSGKRKWRLGRYSGTPNGKYFFFPYSEKTPDEFGSASYEDTFENEVQHLLEENSIENAELTELILKEYNKLEPFTV